MVNTAQGIAKCGINHETLPDHTHKHRQCFKWYIALDNYSLHNCTV